MRYLLIYIAIVAATASNAQNLNIENDYFTFGSQVIDFDYNTGLICGCLGNFGHRSNQWPSFERDKNKNYQVTDTWTRSLKFEVAFDFNSVYNHQNLNQLDWNKLMYVGSNWNEDHVKLGWRYNINSELMDLGLYSHINHTKNILGGDVGREFQFITSIPLLEFHDVELIFGAEGLGVIVDDIGHFIKRNDMHTVNSNVKTNIRRIGYFGGQECYQQDIDIGVFNIRGDNGLSNWHNGACDKVYSRSVFYDYDDLQINAARSITMSERLFRGQYGHGTGNCPSIGTLPNPNPLGLVLGDEIPFLNAQGEDASFVNILADAQIECNAGENIDLLPGFQAISGSFFNAAIDPQIICMPFANDPGSLQRKTLNLEELDMKQSNLNIPYPNPAEDKVSYQSSMPIKQVELLDLTGRVVYQKLSPMDNSITVNLADLEKGIYLLKVSSSDGSMDIHRIVKQ